MQDLTDHLQIVCRTDTGRKREHNEDSVGSDPALGLAVLADGMGGYQAGEVASAMAVSIVLDNIRTALTAAGDGAANPEELIRVAGTAANQAIHEAASGNTQYRGMGTTLVVAMLYGNMIAIGHVGDSRLYRLRGQELKVITEDHSLVRELVRKGFYTEDEARAATNKNVVTRALGVDPSVEVEVQEDMALIDDIYLMCSDGLNDMLDDQTIQKALFSNRENLDEAARVLIELANANGGKDNISVILIRPVKPYNPNRGLWQRVTDWFTSSKPVR